MVATVSIRDSAASVTTVLAAPTAAIRASQFGVTTVYNIPAAAIRASGMVVTTLTKTSNTIRASQQSVTLIGRGRIDSRKVRSWWFSQDGHDFYVLRLGDVKTLVYDLTSNKWMEWADPDNPYWRPQTGLNWLGMGRKSFDGGATSNAVAGDDNYGLLWVIEPERGYDEAPRSDLPDAPFTRKIVGGIPMRMRETFQVGAAYVTMDLGNPQFANGSITLRTSNDSGNTWVDHGTLTVTPSDYSQEFAWRSLGLIRAPGRMFELSDNGATVRIDGLDIR